MTAISDVEASANVRAALKAAFPGVRFSVRVDSGAVTVRWLDGPTRADVEAVTVSANTGATPLDLTRRHSAAVQDKAGRLWLDAAGRRYLPASGGGFLPELAVRGYRVPEGPLHYQLGVIADRIILAAASAENGA